MRPHYNLEAWKNSMDLVDQVYEVSKTFPPDEKYGLTAQIRRSALSVPSNISEGAARSSTSEFAHFVNISLGSLSELETQILIADRRNFISDNDTKSLLKNMETIFSQLHGLRRYLKNQTSS